MWRGRNAERKRHHLGWLPVGRGTKEGKSTARTKTFLLYPSSFFRHFTTLFGFIPPKPDDQTDTCCVTDSCVTPKDNAEALPCSEQVRAKGRRTIWMYVPQQPGEVRAASFAEMSA